MREHFRSLAEQEAELKKTVPDFDLQRELQNPTFLRMTAPGSGLRVADVYFALHRQELQEAAAQAGRAGGGTEDLSLRPGGLEPAGGKRGILSGPLDGEHRLRTHDKSAAAGAQGRDPARRCQRGEDLSAVRGLLPERRSI